MSIDQRRALGFEAPARDGAPVLFMSSNGVGMGHLTRLLAIALRSEPEIRPVFLSLSRAAGVVGGFGYPWEHVSSHTTPGIPSPAWHGVLADHLVHAFDHWGIRGVVFDGVAPYRGLRAAVERRPDVASIWIRRGLWLPDVDHEGVRADWFDRVVQPGELVDDDTGNDTGNDRWAHGRDAGDVVRADAGTSGGAVLTVDPVTLVDRGQLADREEARRLLGLPPDERVLLVALGSGTLTDVAGPMRAVLEGLSRDRWIVARPRSPLPGDMVPPELDVRTFEAYPMARLFRAFDAAIAAAGYNSFHELVVGHVPSLFVPQPRDTDDQYRRAAQATETGVGLAAASLADIPDAVRTLVEPRTRATMRDRLATHDRPNGAVAAAAAIREVVLS